MWLIFPGNQKFRNCGKDYPWLTLMTRICVYSQLFQSEVVGSRKARVKSMWKLNFWFLCKLSMAMLHTMCSDTVVEDEQQARKLGKIFLKMMSVQGRCGFKTWLRTLLFRRKLRGCTISFIV